MTGAVAGTYADSGGGQHGFRLAGKKPRNYRVSLADWRGQLTVYQQQRRHLDFRSGQQRTFVSFTTADKGRLPSRFTAKEKDDRNRHTQPKQQGDIEPLYLTAPAIGTVSCYAGKQTVFDSERCPTPRADGLTDSLGIAGTAGVFGGTGFFAQAK